MPDRQPFGADPGRPWPIGSYCALELESDGLWCCPPRMRCECGRVTRLGAWAPKTLPEACKCGRPVEVLREPQERAA